LTLGLSDTASERFELPIGWRPSSRLPELHALRPITTDTRSAGTASGLRDGGLNEDGSVRTASLRNEEKSIESEKKIWRVDMDLPSGESVSGNSILCRFRFGLPPVWCSFSMRQNGILPLFSSKSLNFEKRVKSKIYHQKLRVTFC